MDKELYYVTARCEKAAGCRNVMTGRYVVLAAGEGEAIDIAKRDYSDGLGPVAEWAVAPWGARSAALRESWA
jgi:hypothetical protein